MVSRQGTGTTIGMGSIKQRRLRLPVICHPNTHVGEYVPFYFCPRSIMLYVIYCANHAELAYRGGQQPIIHLEFDLRQVVQWANVSGCLWAFSLSNAGAVYTTFRSHLDQLAGLNWVAIAARDFRSPDIKEAKQAEFLIQRFMPWHLVERIGVYSREIGQRVADAVRNASHRPRLEIQRGWYFP